LASDITTALVHEHEMAKNTDFQYGFESIIRNTAILDRMLVSAQTDYVIGGVVTPVSGDLAVRVGRMWGNGLSLDLAVYNADVSAPVSLSLPVSEDRVDTLQIRAILEEYDEQRRAFFNPQTENGQYFNAPTKRRLKIECVVLNGVEGDEAAPDAEQGWLKLAEILVSPGMTEIPGENIRGVTAIYQGEENAAWTNQRTRTFSLGSTLELKTILALEHTINGEHREKVIRAGNLDFGTGSNQVNAKKMPLGENVTLNAETLNATLSVLSAIVELAGAIGLIGDTITDMVHEAPDDGAIYGRKGKSWVEVISGGGGGFGNAIEALKLYSKKTLMITNSRIVDRRHRGWDIGLPYPSPTSKVYHFDTDLNDQNQEKDIEIRYTGDVPMLADGEDTNGQIYFNPAVLAVPPYEMKGRSLYGHFSITEKSEVTTNNFAVEAWIRFFDERAGIVFRAGSGAESVMLRIGKKGDVGESYSAAGDDGIEYSEIEEGDIPYSVEVTDPGNYAKHEWFNGSEMIILENEGVDLPKRTWVHIAAVCSPGIFSLYIGTQRIDFEKRSGTAQLMSFTLNAGMSEFNVDELLVDSTSLVEFTVFSENTGNRVPYGNLNYLEKWFVLEAQDPNKVRTNLYDSEQFREAVEEIIDSKK
jgi:hypothetical protein